MIALELEDREGPVWHTPELYPPWEPIPEFRPPQWAFERQQLLMRGSARGGEDYFQYGMQPMFRLPADVTEFVMKHMEPGQTSPWGVTVFIAATGAVYAYPPPRLHFPPSDEPLPRDVHFKEAE